MQFELFSCTWSNKSTNIFSKHLLWIFVLCSLKVIKNTTGWKHLWISEPELSGKCLWTVWYCSVKINVFYLLQKLYVTLANFWIWGRTTPTFLDQELKTSEDWCTTNPNPPINGSRWQGFVAGSPSFELTNCRSGECITDKNNTKVYLN